MICHGDFWPGNVILESFDANEVNQAVPRMTVLDWEMCRRGNGATDVGQFAAEAWLLDRFCGERGLLDTFLKSYVAERKMEQEDRRRVAVHFGTHIGYWPTVVKWANQQETREVVRIGGEVTTKAMNGDWDWLERSMLEELFKHLKS
jgi:thiamine kinase-like enzyme